jgi:hypothetical protein
MGPVRSRPAAARPTGCDRRAEQIGSAGLNGVPAAPARRDGGCPTGPPGRERGAGPASGVRAPGMAVGAAGAEREMPTSEEGNSLRHRFVRLLRHRFVRPRFVHPPRPAAAVARSAGRTNSPGGSGPVEMATGRPARSESDPTRPRSSHTRGPAAGPIGPWRDRIGRPRGSGTGESGPGRNGGGSRERSRSCDRRSEPVTRAFSRLPSRQDD